MDPENTSSSDTASSNTASSNAASGDAPSSGVDPVAAAQNPHPEPVRRARASITALTSLFEDPLTLKPRVRPETGVDEMAADRRTADERAADAMRADETRADARVANQLLAERGTASWGRDSSDSLDSALLTTRPGRSRTEVSETKISGTKISETKGSETNISGAEVSSIDAIDLSAIDPSAITLSATDPAITAPTAPEAIVTEPIPGNPPEPPSDPTALPTETEPPTSSLAPHPQVQIKRHDHHLGLVFPPEQTAANPDIMVDFVDSELWQQLQQRLSGGERFWEPGTSVHLNAQNHLLDSRQLQELGEALDRYDLKLTRIATSRRQTAVAAATAGFSIDQGSELPQLLTLSEDKTTEVKTLTAEPLYLQTTVRSGAEVRHPGSVIIMGDLNPGSSVVADGDILIWGRLRGVAHAGAAGNKGSIILALKLEPTQLRIADALARVPQTAQGPTSPEVAYVTAKGDIRITEAAGFTRPYR